MLVRYCVPILFQETLYLVRDIQSVVGNGEGRVTETWLLENLRVLWLHKLVVELLQERLIGTGRQTGFFIQQSHDTQFALDNVNARLVVREFNERPVDLLPNIFLLFELEDVLVELSVPFRQQIAFVEWGEMNALPAATFRWHS